MTISNDAKNYALIKHANMVRPNLARQPVIEHLAEVALLALNQNLSEEAVAAAWLHDILEDTDSTFREIETLFGNDVAELVDGLTDPKNFSFMPLKQRKEAQTERLKLKSNTVKIIKLCDQISNVRSVLIDPPVDWNKEKCLLYIEGAKKIADVCYGLCPLLDDEHEALYRQRYKFGE